MAGQLSRPKNQVLAITICRNGPQSINILDLACLPPGGAQAILDNFFSEFLATLQLADRIETLEILDSLVVTESGTRNIVERDALTKVTFHSEARRSEMLEKLKRNRIVRIEKRLGGEFVEISHEFLIGPIRRHIDSKLTADDNYRNLSFAIRTLNRYQDVDFRKGTDDLLSRPVFQILHNNCEQIPVGTSDLERAYPELMLRSALALGEDKSTVALWLHRFAEGRKDLLKSAHAEGFRGIKMWAREDYCPASHFESRNYASVQHGRFAGAGLRM